MSLSDEKLTKAEYARHVMAIQRRTTQELANLTEGMWNPHFCSSEAVSYARSYFDAIEKYVAAGRQALGDAE